MQVNPFQQYLDLGWKLCKIEPGTKGPNTPGWNAKENALTSLEGVVGAGLLHVYSGTCAIDIDDWDEAEWCLQEHGINLKDLFMAPGAVTISSGTPDRAKLLYKLNTPLQTIKLGKGKKLEFRCATAAGTSVQDVLPPSVHPSGRKYTMTGDPSKLPALPAELLALWRKNLNPDREHVSEKDPIFSETSRSVTLARIKKVIDNLDPDMPHDDWLQIGMALHYESSGSEEGFKIWNEWSSLSKDKYPGSEVLWSRYNSFGNSPRPITGDFLLHQEVADANEFEAINSPADFMAEPKRPNRFIGQVLFPHQWGTLPKPTWLIPGWLPEHGLGSIWGPPGAAKSFLTIDLAIAVATGGDWRGHRVKQGTVVAIVAEDAFGYRMRVNAALQARGCPTAQFGVIGANLRLQDKPDRDDLLEALHPYGKISLLLVDTMAAAAPGLDENSTKEVTKFVADCRAFQERLGCMMKLVHHTGKDTSRGSRGSSAFHGTFDVEWEIEAERDENVRRLHLYKIRNAPEFDKHGHRFKNSFQLSEADESCSLEWL